MVPYDDAPQEPQHPALAPALFPVQLHPRLVSVVATQSPRPCGSGRHRTVTRKDGREGRISASSSPTFPPSSLPLLFLAHAPK
ncbi:hypothetical protein PAXRUDRAFT_821363 [Paxillus rubicundulus Ve08.2h10]|uniref:Uncharacterized protein n=1 Tax=Paxillus rubicundulus Ve08.2h10 TaxID=930991 RepID=A0A0D0DYE1_9AGAM|nr:hypothetical protein PAXRUDRAFT_821363 [Paxillus rubicundulus Ve08.2h10]